MSKKYQGSFVRTGIKKEGTTKAGKPYKLYEVVVEYRTREYSFSFFGPKELLDQAHNLVPGSELECYINDRGNLERIVVVKQAQQSSSPGAGSSGGSSKSAGPGPRPGATAFREPDEISRTEALGVAVAFYGKALESAGNFTKLVKKSETLDNLQQGFFELADKAYKFIKGELKVADPASSADDMGDPADVDQPDVPDDDIPY